MSNNTQHLPSTRTLVVHFAASVLTLMSGTLAAAEASGYVALTTDYVFRGVTYSDGQAAFQLGGDIAFDSGVYVGAWASTVDIESPNGSTQRDLQVDYYAGYALPVSSNVTLGGNIVMYTFPDSDGPVDYDYAEYSLSLNFDDRLWLEYAYAPDLFGFGIATHNYSLFGELPLGQEFTVDAGIGYYDPGELSDSGYTYWELGIGRPVGQLGLDLRYHDANDWVPIWSDRSRIDSRLVLTAEYRF